MLSQRFATYATLCRLSGCLFIRDFRKNTTANARVDWKGLYTVYSVLCVLVLLLFDAAFLFRRFFFSDFSELFAKFATLIFYVGLSVKLWVNFVTALSGQSQLLAFFRESELFEKTTGFSSCKCSASGIRGTRLLQRLFTVAACVVSFVLGLVVFTLELVSMLPSVWTAPIIVYGLAGGAIHYVYDSLTYLVLVPCCEVLGEYVHVQREAFHDRFNIQKLVSSSSSHAAIEEIRLNICRIKALKDKINDIWGWGLCMTFGGTILIVCLYIYRAMDTNISRSEMWVGIVHSLFFSSISLEMASVSQYMKDEVSAILSRIFLLRRALASALK